MGSILHQPQDNLGGNIKTIHILDYKSSPTINIVAGRVVNNIVLANWNKIDFTQDSVSYSQEQVLVGADTAFRKSVQGNIPKERLEVSTELLRFHRKRVVVVVTDRNGIRRIIGSKANPAVLNFKLTSGPRLSDANRYEVTIAQTDKDQVAFYDIE